MYTSFTLAIPVKKPLEVAQWYKEYLGLSEVQVIDNTTYEVEIMSNLWLQFYSDEKKIDGLPLILRMGVDDLNSIVHEFKRTKRNIELGKEVQGIRYLYSQENPWGQKIGFYELLNEGDN